MKCDAETHIRQFLLATGDPLPCATPDCESGAEKIPNFERKQHDGGFNPFARTIHWCWLPVKDAGPELEPHPTQAPPADLCCF